MSNFTELDLLYSPSRWCKRGDRDYVIGLHWKFAREESEVAKQNIPCQIDVAYGELEDEKYDFFGTDLPSDAPIYIHLHGGYWQKLSRDMSSYMVAPLYKNGIKVFVVGYSLCPKAKVIDIMYQIKKAIAKCMAYAEENNAKYITIGGHSAGAHLITCLFTNVLGEPINNKIIRSLYLISGVYDLTPLVDTYVNEPLRLTKDEAKIVSPLHQTFGELHNNDTLFHVIVGEHETPKFLEQSKLMYEKFKELNFKTDLQIHTNLDHFDIVEKLNDEQFTITQAIINELKS